MKRFFALSILLAAASLVSCLPEEQHSGQPSGSIVVVGNGAESPATMIFDVQTEDRIQSHIVTKESDLEPVVQLVGNRYEPARVNWIAKDITLGLNLAQVEVDPTQTPVIVNASEGLERSQRLEALETLEMSRDIRPLFLSNGGLVYVSRTKDLVYTIDRVNKLVIDRKVSAFLIDAEGRLFWNLGQDEWKFLRLNDVSKDSDSKPKFLYADLVFLNSEGRLSVLVWKPRAEWPKGTALYQMNSDETFKRTTDADLDFRILETRAAPFHERGSSILAKIARQNHLAAEWRALFLGRGKFEFWPTEKPLSEGAEIHSGSQVMALRGAKTDSHLEVCGLNAETINTCKSLEFDFVPKQVSVGAQDHIFATRALAPTKRGRDFMDPDDYDPSAQISEVVEVVVNAPDGSFGKEAARYELVGEVLALRFFPDLELVAR